MNVTTHEFPPEEVMAFVDGELAAERATAVSGHIKACAECSALVADLYGVSRKLAGWRTAEVPAKLEGSLNSSGLTGTAREEGISSRVLKRRSSSRSRWVLIAGCGAAALFLLITLSAPNLMRSRIAANEASAAGELRTVNTALSSYAAKYGHYPPSLQSLGPSQGDKATAGGADLIDPPLGSGQKSGYLFTYHANGGEAYTINADPLNPGSNGYRHFSTDQTGVIRADGQPIDGNRSQTVALSSPGYVADANGLAHGIGDKAQNAFSVDGQPITSQQSRVFSGPMIVRTASLSIVVKDFEAGRAALDAILARHSGYAANLNVSTPQAAGRTLQASLRIPAPQLANTLAELKSLGRVEAESQYGEEVTEQHADLVARLKNSRETEQRLQDVLRTRTGKVKDVLEVEQEIARVRGEIEQMEAEQKSLEHRVEFATVELRLSEQYKAQLRTPAPSVSMQLRNSTVNGFRNAFESLLGLLLFLAEAGPTLLLWAAILCFPAWRLWCRYRRAQLRGSSPVLA